MDDQSHEDAYRSWRTSLTTLLADGSLLARWQERRYRFAHRVGALLTEENGDGPATAGPVLYGVFASGAGLCYVGQTQAGERRLRDLPVGESHHLANTVPPELWERVVVIRWPLLLSGAPEDEQSVATEIGPGVCGLALEHALQVKTAPPLNSRRRTAGGWQPRVLARSRSRGAVHSQSMPGLNRLVLEAWEALSEMVRPEHSAVVDTRIGRVVFPSALHEPPAS
ncbi:MULTISPECIES: hypothetical protein [unclassified Streptomyces]|uniref:hypothetical protein n=1 Tax=Streptomyces sp. NBC_00304 TaxID=2975706 RepID=UPI002E2D55BC|nr:hypothetical protein [Streptomyces sp. NBC_00304]